MKLLPCPGKHPERLLSHEELRRWRRNGQAAAWCEVQLGHETLSVGKSANSAEDCTLELCGRWLAYRIALSRSVGLMDSGDEPEMYLGVGDGSPIMRDTVRTPPASLREALRARCDLIPIRADSSGSVA